MIFNVCIETASGFGKLLCGRSLCGPSHSIRETISSFCLVRFKTSVVTFCLQRSMHAVVNKTSGGPGDFRSIFLSFCQNVGYISVQTPKPMRPVISIQVFFVVLWLEANMQPARKRQVAAAFFSCSSPPPQTRQFKFLKLNSSSRGHHFVIQVTQFSYVSQNLLTDH